MALQMLVLLPGVFAAGWLSARLAPARWQARAMAVLRPHALSLLVVAALGYGLWMLPIALDLARLSPAVNAAKFATVFVAGLSTGIALRVAAWPLVLFFGGNMVWMGLTFGMLFIDAPARLCASYLIDDQRMAGVGLVAGSVGVGVWLLAWVVRRAGWSNSEESEKNTKDWPAIAVNAGQKGLTQQGRKQQPRAAATTAAPDKGPDRAPD
ncbi:hypothetical protein AB4120_05335 [Cupriavidus sp. 2KB_3]